jgi:uncharacterized membrane protein
MKNNKITTTGRRAYGWLLIAIGIALFVTGLLVRNFVPETPVDSHLLEGLGILIFAWGVIPVSRQLSARRDPLAARRSQLAEEDERALSIRNQAAYIAFLFANVTTAITLIVYSAYTRGQTGFDPLWYAMAFLVIAPMLVFVGVLTNINKSK